MFALQSEAHRDEIKAIVTRHRGTAVALFGSVARGEETPECDTDLLIGSKTILAITRFLEVNPGDFGPVIAERRRQAFALSSPDAGSNPDRELTGAGAGGRSLVALVGRRH